MTHIFLSLLLSAGVKGSLVCAAALLIVFRLRTAAPALRHAILFTAIMSFVAVPIAELALPTVRLPVSLPAVMLDTVTAPAGPDAQIPMLSVSAETPDADASIRDSFSVVLLILWAVGALFLLVRSLFARRLLFCLERASFPLGGPDAGTAAKMVAAAAPDRAVRILRTAWRGSPLTFGILRPIILLPEIVLEKERDSLTALLAHELAHVRRRDVLTAQIAYIVCCLFWFSPVAWLALFRQRVEQEKASDLSALSYVSERAQYAKMLLRLRVLTVHTSFHARFSAQVSGESALEERIRNILYHDEQTTFLSKAIRSTALSAIGVYTMLVSATRFVPVESPVSVTRTSGAVATDADRTGAFMSSGEGRETTVSNLYNPSTVKTCCSSLGTACCRRWWEACCRSGCRPAGAQNRKYRRSHVISDGGNL